MSGKLYVVAGEMSGDAHAAGLLAELVRMRPAVEITGHGGPKMQAAAGSGIRDWLAESSIMGLVEVLRHYRFFRHAFHQMLDEVRTLRPDVLLLVDYPGFNLRLASAVKRELPEVKIVQYVCPQVWAWKKRRAILMAEILDEVLCLLPFEPEIFGGTGLKAQFVGHPLIDEIGGDRENVTRQSNLVALLPGSRAAEIEKLLPVMLESAGRLRARHPELTFAIPAANPALARRIRKLATGYNLGTALEVREGGAHRLMQEAACGVVASGTASLEAALFGLPYCLIYKLAWPTYLVAKMVVKTPYVGLVNILAKEPVVAELIQSDADSCNIVAVLNEFLTEPRRAQELQARMAEVVKMLGGPGAHQRAAEAVNQWFGPVV